MLGLTREGRPRSGAHAQASSRRAETLAFGGVELELLAERGGPGVLRALEPRFALPARTTPTVARVVCSLRVDSALTAPLAEPPNALCATTQNGSTRLASQGLCAELVALGHGRYAAAARVASGPAAASHLVRALSATVLRLEGGLTLHAAGVDLGGRAVAYLGPSGAGKSTAVRLTDGGRCFAEDHLALVPSATGWSAWALPGGSPSGAPASSRTVLPLAALVRVRWGRATPVLTPLAGADALFAVREAVESDDCAVDVETSRLSTVGRLAREVNVATIHTVLDRPIGGMIERWLAAGSRTSAASGRGSALA